MELLYVILVMAMLLEVFLFVLLNVPTPTGVKGKIAGFLSNTRKTQVFLLFHLVVCVIAGLLYVDCNRMDEKYRAERQVLIEQNVLSTELRKSELSYKLLILQRNKYICFMAIFTSIALNVFVSVLKYMYQKRERFDLRKKMAAARDSGQTGNRTSTDSN